MTTVSDNLQSVRTRIARACAACQRPVNEVTLLAVSKTFGPEAVLEAHHAGQVGFGENYIQEAVEKMAHLPPALEWHCIGPIQSNKTRLVATHFHWAQTVDRLKIAQRLSEQRGDDQPPLFVCIQVNVDGGATKAGVPPEEVPALARAIAQLPRLQLRGLMAIPDPVPEFAAQKALFARARVAYDRLRGEIEGIDTLSMGMTADLEAAIHAGSTMVRVGTAVFGSRPSARAG